MIKAAVGLGNPGKPYIQTRHNVGYRVIESLEKDPPERLILFKPESVFMNESGRPVAQLLRRKGLEASEVLVICDDFSIPLGMLRLRLKGSSGGHNGLDSILTTLCTQDVPRLRLGIGPVPALQDPADFVLERFASAERDRVEELVQTAAAAVRTVISEGWETAMNRYNRKAA